MLNLEQDSSATCSPPYLAEPYSSQALAIPRASPLLGLLERILAASLVLPRTLRTCLLEEKRLFSNWIDPKDPLCLRLTDS